MTTPPVTLTREQLYELVWTEPTRSIAELRRGAPRIGRLAALVADYADRFDPTLKTTAPKDPWA